MLHEWKEKAEESAKCEQGKKLPAEQDAVNTLVAAATGQSSGFLPNLVPNAIKAESSYWEKIYPRFTVETSYHRGETHRTFYAKEDCKFKIIIKDYYNNEFERKMNESIKHGSVSILDASAVTIPSLPIINEPLDCSYSYETIEFIPLPRRKVIIRIQAVSPDSGIEQFYDIDGHLFAGTESITAEGIGLDNLLLIDIKILKYKKPIEAKVNFIINYQKWNNKILSAIPYFDKIWNFYSKLKNGWDVKFSVEIDGYNYFSVSYYDSRLCANQFAKLDFIRTARELTKVIDHPVKYSDLSEIDDVLYLKLKSILSVLREGICKIPFMDTLIITTVVDTYLYTKLAIEGYLMEISYDQEEFLDIFNQKILLPRLSHTFTALRAEIRYSDIDKISNGDTVEIKLTPIDGCEHIIEKIPSVENDE